MSRGSAWSDAEVTALISIWGDAAIQEQLDGATRNKTIFATISKKLHENGYNRDWQQCRAKIKNLKGEYKKVKDHNGVTGNGRKSFKFFAKLDEILGHRPASAPTVLVDTGSPSIGTATTHIEESDTEDGETEGKHTIIYIVVLFHLRLFNTDIENESNVQVLSSVDGAALSEPEPADKEDHGKLQLINTVIYFQEHVCNLMTIGACSPKKKKCKIEKTKKSKGEKAMEKAIESFITYQNEAEEKFKKWEEERWEKETEFEEKRRREDREHDEKRRREDREHEVRLFEMLGQMVKPRERFTPSYSTPPFNYEY